MKTNRLLRLSVLAAFRFAASGLAKDITVTIQCPDFDQTHKTDLCPKPSEQGNAVSASASPQNKKVPVTANLHNTLLDEKGRVNALSGSGSGKDEKPRKSFLFRLKSGLGKAFGIHKNDRLAWAGAAMLGAAIGLAAATPFGVGPAIAIGLAVTFGFKHFFKYLEKH